MKTIKEKVEAYVRRQIPELMELSFGCEVLCTYNPNKSSEKPQLKMTMIGESDIDDGIDGGLFHFLRKNVEYVGDTTETSTYWTVVEIIGHPIQIQHWLRVLPKYHLELGATANFLYAEYSGTDKTVSINLTTGQPATEVDYQAIADILNIEV